MNQHMENKNPVRDVMATGKMENGIQATVPGLPATVMGVQGN
jgi:hypothetical protein